MLFFKHIYKCVIQLRVLLMYVLFIQMIEDY